MYEGILKFAPDFYEWPKKWMGVKKDLPVGQEIVKVFEPFLLHLIEKGYKEKTIKRHATNLWILGGELVREVSIYEELDKSIEIKIMESIDEEGGPDCRHLQSEEEINSYNTTCRKFSRFLNNE